MRRVLALLGTAAFACSSACSLLLDYTGIDDGKDAQPGCDASCIDAPTQDVAQDAPKDAGGDQIVPTNDSGCAGQGGPASVRIGGFCIDSTEVTNAQYKAFLDAIGQGYTPNKPSGCGGKTSFAPATASNGCTTTTFDPVGHAAYPVGCVDWCDAWAFCTWAGKRLCGEVDGGGSMPFDYVQVGSTAGEWYTTCSGGGLYVFPWASGSPDDSRCNTTCMPKGDGGPIAVGTDTTCTTPTGISDLGGNQSEWVNSCGGTSPGDLCFTEGDSFANKTGPYCSDCGANALSIRGYTGMDIGFRCCGNAL